MRPGKIYTLLNPENNAVFYVGSSRIRLNMRLNIHVCTAINRPAGNVGEYIQNMSSRPVIEEIASFDRISNDDLRKEELYWCRQLKAMGFPLVNNQRPYNDNEPSIRCLSKEIVSTLQSNIRLIWLVSTIHNLGLSNTCIRHIIKTGRCTRETYSKLRFLLYKVQTIDKCKLYISPRALMINLSDDQIAFLKRIMQDINKAEAIMGISHSVIYRLINNKKMRLDKYLEFERISQIKQALFI